jgi:hypothetical protein
MELKREIHNGVDISAAFTVLTYEYTGASSRLVIPRVNLGDSTKPIAGGRSYAMQAKIDGAAVTPVSNVSVPATVNRAVMQGRQVTLEQGDTLTIEAAGDPADIDVNTVCILSDATPAQASDLTGMGQVVVDHDYDGADNYRYITSDGAGIGGAVVRAYLASEYSQGNRSRDYILAEVRTTSSGRWDQAMMLDPGTYTLVFYKQGSYGPDVTQVIVSE